MLELGRRILYGLDRFFEESQPACAAFDQTGHAKGSGERTGRTPAAGMLQLFGCEAARLLMLAKLEQGQGGGRAPGDERRVAASDEIEAAACLYELLGASGQITAKDAQPGAAVAQKEDAFAVQTGLAEGDAGQGGRGLVELALFHQRVGEKRRGVSIEPSACSPSLAEGQRLASLCFGFAQIPSPQQHKQAKDLSGGERERRSPPVRFGKRILESHQSLVEIGHREGDDGR